MKEKCKERKFILIEHTNFPRNQGFEFEAREEENIFLFKCCNF